MVAPPCSLEGDPNIITIQYWLKEMLGDRGNAVQRTIYSVSEKREGLKEVASSLGLLTV